MYLFWVWHLQFCLSGGFDHNHSLFFQAGNLLDILVSQIGKREPRVKEYTPPNSKFTTQRDTFIRPIHKETKRQKKDTSTIITSMWHSMSFELTNQKDISDRAGRQKSCEPAAYRFGSSRPTSSPPHWELSALYPSLKKRPCAHTRPGSDAWLTRQTATRQMARSEKNRDTD